MRKCTSVINFKCEKPTSKEWKLKPSELPGPGQEKETLKSYNFTQPSSPTLKFKTDKRVIFAEAIAKQKALVPSPSAYKFENFNEKKVWKRLTVKRH